MKAKKIFLAAIALTCIFSTYNSFSDDEDGCCPACGFDACVCPETHKYN